MTNTLVGPFAAKRVVGCPRNLAARTSIRKAVEKLVKAEIAFATREGTFVPELELKEARNYFTRVLREALP